MKNRHVAGRRQSGRPTLAQVAREAGVSITTVSAVLNGRSDCWASTATRQRVQEAARKLGYRPNLAARSLKSGLTHTLGLITTALNVASPRNRINGMDEAAAAAGYAVIMSFHMNDPAIEDQMILRHLDRGVDGIAIYTSDSGRHEELRRLVERGFPVVTFDGEGRLDFDRDDVSPDYRAVGELQVRHLLETGRRRIAAANPIPSARINDIREDAVRMALARADAPPPLFMNLHRPADREVTDAEEIYRPAKEWIAKRKGEFDAVVAFDSVACVVIRVLLEAGLRVPEDVAVMGAGNSMLSDYGAIPISSIDTSDSQMGAEAFALLLARIEGQTPAAGFHKVKVNPMLVPRRSTRCGA